LAAWLESNVPEALAVFVFPADHRRRNGAREESNERTIENSHSKWIKLGGKVNH
jgi:hypothetical protein